MDPSGYGEFVVFPDATLNPSITTPIHLKKKINQNWEVFDRWIRMAGKNKS